MSDELVEVSAEEPVGSPVSEDVSEAQDTTPYLSVEEYSNHRVPVKLDGEELQVPLSEAIAGYQRQADYTRKTQELSQQRDQFQFASALEAALQRDPAATIDMLSNHYGISREAVSEMVSEDDGFQYLDSSDDKYKQLDRRIASFEEFQTQQQVEREVEGLQAKYQDFNIQEVVNAALRSGSTDLEGTYKQIAFDKMMAKEELARKAAEKQQQNTNGVVAAKRQAGVVSGGSSATSNTTSENFQPITSVSEAWKAAKRSMGAD